ncbi:MAG TPA: GNAT family N-acetyltransferase [Syntrophomonadaceae bacterium]|nr:GNAT family N-acetyltransferase [Syntrophomonadaceae bacterium]
MTLAGENLSSPVWTLRRAQESDIEAMLSFWSSIQEIQSSLADSRKQVQRFLADNPCSFLVACSENRVVGTVMGGYNGWRGSIYHLAVQPEYRGQGIGRALLLQCLEILQRRGAPRVDLTTYASNKNAQAFYRKLGWRERTEIKNFSFEYTHDTDNPEH